jgi:thiamine-monophosphate kinase
MREANIIGRIGKELGQMRGPMRRKKVLLRMGDDAALLAPATACETILTCDWFLEGTHFLRKLHRPDTVGWKCLARAVSDIAAMGGSPLCFLLSLALPESCSVGWLERFLAGLRHAARRLGLELAGGDTTRHRQILISITVVGEVLRGRAVRRSGARPGDLIWVSGRLGEAQLGFELLRKGLDRHVGVSGPLRKHLYPEPRIELGRWLAEKHLVTAMIDVSDGLSTDLGHICQASGAGARVDARKIPLPRLPRLKPAQFDPLQLALQGGEDYELLFTVPRRLARQLPRTYRGLLLTEIGQVTRGEEMLLIESGERSRPLTPRGWDPFAKLRCY